MMKYINKQRIVIAVIVLIIAVIFFIFHSKSKDNNHIIPGYIEANLSYISADQVSGQLQYLDVQKGQSVKKGQRLFALDGTQYQLEDQKNQHNVYAKLAAYQDLLTGKRPEYIKQIDADIVKQSAEVDYLEKRYQRAKLLLESDSTSQEEYDLAKSQYEQSRAHLASLEYQKSIDMLKARAQQIMNAKSNVKVAKSEQELSKWRLQQTEVVSPNDAVVFDTYYWPGEQVALGRAVVSLLVRDRVKLIFYLPINILHSIKLGQTIYFTIDGDSQRYPGKISYISPQAEYMPPVVYSQSARQDLSFKIEARIDSSIQANWHPGQPVDVILAGPNDV